MRHQVRLGFFYFQDGRGFEMFKYRQERTNRKGKKEKRGNQYGGGALKRGRISLREEGNIFFIVT